MKRSGQPYHASKFAATKESDELGKNKVIPAIQIVVWHASPAYFHLSSGRQWHWMDWGIPSGVGFGVGHDTIHPDFLFQPGRPLLSPVHFSREVIWESLSFPLCLYASTIFWLMMCLGSAFSNMEFPPQEPQGRLSNNGGTFNLYLYNVIHWLLTLQSKGVVFPLSKTMFWWKH